MNKSVKSKKKKGIFVIEKTTELAPLAEVTSLSVNMTERAVGAMQSQRSQLAQFVSSQLKQGMNGDYAQIPGTHKKSLLKPGAEKLANLFKLGSRIVSKERDIDREAGFAMFSYTFEIFHIPTGAVIAQCEGSANSEEKKNIKKPFADQLNSLGKMAQKRAFVGGVIMAVGASDFFTQDLEDMPNPGAEKAKEMQTQVMPNEPKLDQSLRVCSNCSAVLKRTKADNAWYCANYQDKSQGEHDYIKD